MKRLTSYEMHSIISHAEAMQAERRGLVISLDVQPLDYRGVGIGFTVARRQGNDKPLERLQVLSHDTLEDKGFTTVQEIIDLMSDTVCEVMA